jgi:hypothetical protein
LSEVTDTSRTFPRLRTALLVAVASFATSAVPISAAGHDGPRGMILYSVTEQEQFINNQDDRARGEGHNPFGSYSDVSQAVTKPKAGPFPGDEALFSFNIYKKPDLTLRAGTAIFTCQYNFAKNAFCDVSFQLNNGGTLIAEGAFNFDASRFTLAITGGYGKYTDVTGELEASPSPNHAQRLSFMLD